MYVRPKLTFVSFFYVFFLHLPLNLTQKYLPTSALWIVCGNEHSQLRHKTILETCVIWDTDYNSDKDITSYQHPGCYRGWVIARFGLQWNIYSETKLWYETGLLIGHTHILFYFIFQLLVQKHKIFNIKGVSKVTFTCGYSHWPKSHQTKWIELF